MKVNIDEALIDNTLRELSNRLAILGHKLTRLSHVESYITKDTQFLCTEVEGTLTIPSTKEKYNSWLVDYMNRMIDERAFILTRIEIKTVPRYFFWRETVLNIECISITGVEA